MPNAADAGYRMYTDLAWLWPIVGNKEAYGPEAAEVLAHCDRRLGHRPQTLLHLASGGGSRDFHLKRSLAITGVDRSPQMLSLAKNLNPECHYFEGDMTTVQLGQTFDVVLIDDATAYFTEVEQLASSFRVAYSHLRPGGVIGVWAETTSEQFVQNETQTLVRSNGPVEVTLIENRYDPDPLDSCFEATFVYLIRSAGKLSIETDRQILGLFPVALWTACLADAGFVEISVDTLQNGGPRLLFGLRPSESSHPCSRKPSKT